MLHLILRKYPVLIATVMRFRCSPSLLTIPNSNLSKDAAVLEKQLHRLLFS